MMSFLQQYNPFARSAASLRDPDNRFWQAFFYCALASAVIFLPFVIVDGGYFHYAGDFNSQQITFYRYMNEFATSGATFSWETDLGSGALNAYSFYLYGSPFFWLSVLLPQNWMPYMMVPLLILKFAVGGAGAYLYLRRYVKNQDYAVIGACLYALSGFAVYNVFFNHFVDVVALFPYLLWSLDAAIYERKRGWFGVLIALNFINNYFFFIGQVVFICIYFFCKLFSGAYRITKKCFARLAVETLLGAGMGALMAIPAFLSLLENPRSIDFSSGFGFLMYSSVQQYFAILLSVILPPDSPYIVSIFSEGVIKWTSLTAYLPLCSAAGVLAYWKTRGATWEKRVLFTCAVFAFVPVLNSLFYALNSSYYARWYYMPVLIMVLATVTALDEAVDFKEATIKIGLVMCATLAFAFIPVYDSTEEVWSFGVLETPAQYIGVLTLGVCGLILFAWVNENWRGTAVYAKRLLATLLVFSCVYSIVHIGIGKFGQWDGDATLDAEYLAAASLKESMPEGEYRIDTYECYDNLALWIERSGLQYFGSTAAPSILSFYPSVGVKRDVSSKPDVDEFALRGLLSVRYTIVPQSKEQLFIEEELEGWTRAFESDGYVLFENENFLPMGFTYDYYLTADDYDAISVSQRAQMLLRAIVLSEEQVELVRASGTTALAPLPDSEYGGLTYEGYTEDISQRRADVCTRFETNGKGFIASAALDAPNLVFFAVPWDAGFSAQVNGEDATVWNVDNGLMAIWCEAGENEIVVSYEPEGWNVSLPLALVCAVLFCIYLCVMAYCARKRGEQQPCAQGGCESCSCESCGCTSCFGAPKKDIISQASDEQEDKE